MLTEQIPNMTVSDIKKAVEAAFPPEEATLQVLEQDPRSGVRQLAVQVRRRKRADAKEDARLEQMGSLENKLRARGLTHIAGVDEAGRGPLAGPVTAAAVILPAHTLIVGLNDSKKLSEQKREILFDQIRTIALAIGVGEATPQEIDTLNIRNATHLAMRRAIDALSIPPDRILIDGNALPESKFAEMAIIGGDRKSISIAAASIIAKVTRDRLMVKYDLEYPEYGLAGHKGYGSAQHLAALRKHGPTPIHRHTFAGVPHNFQAFSADFDDFAEGIAAADSLPKLTAMGETIGSASSSLPPQEIQALRDLYSKKRTTLERPGNKGEALATAFLRKNGFTIREKNYRAVGGEIDIIAQKNDVLSFVEVKTATQSSFGAPQTWVTAKKQRQIIKIARAYLIHNHWPSQTLRFDVITVDLTTQYPKVTHIEAAFSESP
ncbi:MAG: ribonuclease HII [Candidatus Latescibacterota bacterium]|jgi:ribonuclease HII